MVQIELMSLGFAISDLTLAFVVLGVLLQIIVVAALVVGTVRILRWRRTTAQRLDELERKVAREPEVETNRGSKVPS